MVRCLVLHTLTSISSVFAFSPITIPEYTFSPAPMNSSTAFLGTEQSVSYRFACLKCDQRALLTVSDVSLVRSIAVKCSIDDTISFCICYRILHGIRSDHVPEYGIRDGYIRHRLHPMFCSSPLRWLNLSMTVPVNSSGTSI